MQVCTIAMVARAIAIVHTCIYDAWAAFDSVAVGTRLGGSLRRPAAEHTLDNKQQAISYAADRAQVDLFPTDVPLFDFMMAKLGYDSADRSTDTTTPTGIGNMAAQAVIEGSQWVWWLRGANVCWRTVGTCDPFWVDLWLTVSSCGSTAVSIRCLCAGGQANYAVQCRPHR